MQPRPPVVVGDVPLSSVGNNNNNADAGTHGLVVVLLPFDRAQGLWVALCSSTGPRVAGPAPRPTLAHRSSRRFVLGPLRCCPPLTTARSFALQRARRRRPRCWTTRQTGCSRRRCSGWARTSCCCRRWTRCPPTPSPLRPGSVLDPLFCALLILQPGRRGLCHAVKLLFAVPVFCRQGQRQRRNQEVIFVFYRHFVSIFLETTCIDDDVVVTVCCTNVGVSFLRCNARHLSGGRRWEWGMMMFRVCQRLFGSEKDALLGGKQSVKLVIQRSMACVANSRANGSTLPSLLRALLKL